MTPPATEHANGRRSSADRVYDALRARVLRGELPANGRLVEQQLAADFGTSRTPVREALRRLEGDGHLVRDPSGGLRPTVPSVRSMRELYDVRAALEELVARRAAMSGDRGLVEQLRQDWAALEAEQAGDRAGDRGDEAGFVHVDEAFHERLAEAAGNEVARAMLHDLNERIRVLRIHDFTVDDRVRSTIAEHLEILDAVLAGEPDAAASFMRAHVQRSALVVRDRVGAALARMFGGG